MCSSIFSNFEKTAMKTSIFTLIVFSILVFSCNQKQGKKEQRAKSQNFEQRIAKGNLNDSSLIKGHSYLPIYSEIYSNTEHITHSLTTTVSLRNMSLSDSLYIVKADYYDTHGELIKNYVEQPIYIAPLETVEIVIPEGVNDGGTGANFNFDWLGSKNNEPLFQAVMISTSGQQGLSFTTQGVRVY